MRILEGLYPSGQSELTNTYASTADKYVGVKDTGVGESCGEYNIPSLPLTDLKSSGVPSPGNSAGHAEDQRRETPSRGYLMWRRVASGQKGLPGEGLLI